MLCTREKEYQVNILNFIELSNNIYVFYNAFK